MNNFFADYLAHIIDEDDSKPFLTSEFVPYKETDQISMRYLPFILSLMDLSFSTKKTKQQHKIRSDDKRGIIITTGSNCILFRKEIKESNCQFANDVIVVHRYEDMLKRSEDEVEDFIINNPYEC